ATVLGLILLPAVSWFVRSIGMLAVPLVDADAVRIPGTGLVIGSQFAVVAGIVGILVSAAIIVGIAPLHAVLTRSILVPSREAMRAEQARPAGVQREGAVRAGEVERTRSDRDRHDGAQPRRVSGGMTLGLAQQKIDTAPAAAKELIDE